MLERPAWRGCLNDIIRLLRDWCRAYRVNPEAAGPGDHSVIELVKAHAIIESGAQIDPGLAELTMAQICPDGVNAPSDRWPVHVFPPGELGLLRGPVDRALRGMKADGLRPPLTGKGAGNPVHRAYDELNALRNCLKAARRRPGIPLPLGRSPDYYAELFQAAIDACPETEPAGTPEALVKTFTVAALRGMTGLGNTALNSYAKPVGVRTPRRGQRNYQYPAAGVHKILCHTIEQTSEDTLRAKCRPALADFKETAE